MLIWNKFRSNRRVRILHGAAQSQCQDHSAQENTLSAVGSASQSGCMMCHNCSNCWAYSVQLCGRCCRACAHISGPDLPELCNVARVSEPHFSTKDNSNSTFMERFRFRRALFSCDTNNTSSDEVRRPKIMRTHTHTHRYVYKMSHSSLCTYVCTCICNFLENHFTCCVRARVICKC